jgi:hypothetical protein
MIFEPTQEDQEICFKEGYSKIFFFGGRLAEERRLQLASSPLYELHIVWSKTLEPQPESIEIH